MADMSPPRPASIVVGIATSGRRDALRDTLAQLDRTNGGSISAASAAEDDEVVVMFSH